MALFTLYLFYHYWKRKQKEGMSEERKSETGHKTKQTPYSGERQSIHNNN